MSGASEPFVGVHPDAGLTDAQANELLSLLLKKRQQLVTKLADLNQQIVAKQDCSVVDAAEAASLREEAARAGGIAAEHNKTIAEIDDALSRLKSGEYGISELSGEPIPLERLLTVPWARAAANE